jgi:hypothetical protein
VRFSPEYGFASARGFTGTPKLVRAELINYFTQNGELLTCEPKGMEMRTILIGEEPRFWTAHGIVSSAEGIYVLSFTTVKWSN